LGALDFDECGRGQPRFTPAPKGHDGAEGTGA